MKIRLYHLPVQLPASQAPRGPAINIMPLGLLALAHHLEQQGHRAEVVHAGVEMRLDPGFDVVADLVDDPPDLVGFTLHWHPQLGPVGDALDRLYEQRPALPVVLGGMTASAFAEEILGHWPGVDFVIRGEGEVPLAGLVEHLETGTPGLAEIPNLAHRRASGAIELAPLSYVAGPDEMDALEPCRLDLLRHGRHYNAQFARTHQGWRHAPVFYLTVGRGCSVDCVFCSGGRGGHRLLAGRQGPIFRSVPRVVDDLDHLARLGINTAVICFDPPGASAAYYRDLFAAVVAAELSVSLVFEAYAPPPTGFIEAFALAFRRPGSRLTFSPTVADDGLRKQLLGVRYTNADLERALTDCRRLSIPTTLYFATLPQESVAQLEGSLAWQRSLVRRFHCRLIHSPVEIEPYAPWSLAPDRYGLRNVRHGFAAFEQRHRDHATLGVCFRREVGYDFPDVDTRVVRIGADQVDPGALLASALSDCGQGMVERIALVGPKRLDTALELLAAQRGQPMVLLLAGERPTIPGWDTLRRIADHLGPNVIVAPFDSAHVRHVAWDGDRLAGSAKDETVLVALHLRDGRAADRAMAPPWAALPPGALLAETCRWRPAPCPARTLQMVAFAQDGALRCCPSSPPLGGDTLEELQEQLAERAGAVPHQRGCAHCPVQASCSQCLYTGRIPAALFCDLRRRLGAAGLTAFALPSGPSRIEIGWDE